MALVVTILVSILIERRNFYYNRTLKSKSQIGGYIPAITFALYTIGNFSITADALPDWNAGTKIMVEQG
jgi:hypothetical protein